MICISQCLDTKDIYLPHYRDHLSLRRKQRDTTIYILHNDVVCTNVHHGSDVRVSKRVGEGDGLR